MTEPAFPDAAWYRALPAEARAEFEDDLAAATSTSRPATLAAWRSTGEVYADPELLAALSADSDADAERTPTAHRDGYTIAVYLPPQASAEARDQLFDTLAEAAHAAEDGWDAHVVGLPGDPLGAVDGEARP